MAAGRRALVVATYAYADGGLSRLAAPAHDAESFASVLEDPAIAGFDVTMLVNKPHYEVGEAIADFYGNAHRDDLTLLYFTGHGVKDDEGRLYLAMTNTRRAALMFTAISAAQLNDAMDASTSRRKVLILDCCYSGAFPAGRAAKSDEGVQTLERFQGKGRAVLTASDATQYAFEGDDLRGTGTSSVFTRHLVEAIRSGAADLDEDGDIALDELYSYVYEQVVAEMPQQRPKKQEDVDGRILIARNVHWTLPAYLQHAIESPIAAQRLNALEELEHLHVVGNDVVRAAVDEQMVALAGDDSRSVSAAATALLERLAPATDPPAPVEVPAPRATPPAARVEPPSPTAEQPRAQVTVPPPPRVPKPTPPIEAPVPDQEPVAVASTEPPGAEPRPSAPRATGRDVVSLVLALVGLSAVPLTLSRLTTFETSNGNTADEFNESTIPWTLMIVLPLVAAAGLLAARRLFPRALPVAFGLVMGTALVVLENAVFWFLFFVTNGDSYPPGPALLWLVLGAAVLAAAGVLVLLRSPVAGRPTLRADWRVACALVVVAAAVLELVAGPETFSVSEWIAAYIGTLLLVAVALALTLLRLRGDQRTAGLVVITLFGLWSIYFPVQELVAPRLYLESSVWFAEIVSVALTLLACFVAQFGPERAPGRPSIASSADQ